MSAILVLAPAAALATQPVPYALFPGEKYRLAFIVDFDSRVTATNPDVTFYNNYLTNLANAVPELAALGTTWSLMGHTPTVKAWDNTNSNPSLGPGVPVYQLDGGSRVADNYDDLWDSALYTGLDVDQFGAEAPAAPSGGGAGYRVWSGGSFDFDYALSGSEIGAASGATYWGYVRAHTSWDLHVAAISPPNFLTEPQGEAGYIRGMSDAVLEVPLAPAPTQAQAGRIALLARQGDASPTGNGTLNFIQDRPVVNDSGEILFAAEYAFTDGGFGDRAAAILHDGSGLVDLARGGNAAPDGNGILSDVHGAALANDGTALFYAEFTNTSGGPSDNDAVIAVDNGLELVLREDAPEPGGNGTIHTISFAAMPPLALNELGTLAIDLSLADVTGGAGSTNVVIGEAGSMTELVRRGEPTPSGNGEYGNFSPPSINEFGQVAVSISGLANSTPNQAGNGMILRQDPGNVGVTIARANDAAPDANGKFGNFGTDTALNNAGEVAFVASFTNSLGGSSGDGFAVLRGDGTELDIMARTGEAAPDGNGEFLNGFGSGFGPPLINDFGSVAFRTRYRNTAGGSTDDRAIVKVDLNANGRQMRDVVREGWLMANGVDRFDTPGEAIDMNAAGVVLFESDRRDAANIRRDGGIFLGDGFEIVQVALASEAIGGGVSVGRVTGNDHGVKPGSLNKHGQVAFRGSEGVFLFTPALYWRGGPDGRWDDEVVVLGERNPASRRNFTLGLVPDAVHDVVIDPARAAATGAAIPTVDVAGPLADVTVNRLSLLDGASLRLLGSHLTTTESIDVASGALLYGAGEVSGPLHIESGGILRTENTASIDAQCGTFPDIESCFTRHSDLVVNGDTVNHGAIQLFRTGGADATFNGNVTNHGDTVSHDVGVSVFGTSIFNGDFTNNGSLVVGENRIFEFHGDYYGPGTIINDGDLTFYGGFYPGASPVSAEVGGTGTLTLNSAALTVIELGGTQRGAFHGDPAAEYDSLDFVDGGTLALGGTLEIALIALEEPGPVFTPEDGDVFLLFSAGLITGAFDHPPVLPELAEGLRWLVLNDGQTFSLSVHAVPLPGAVWMLCAALGLMPVFVRRRR